MIGLVNEALYDPTSALSVSVGLEVPANRNKAHLATDEGLSIFCCELAFVYDRCDLLLDLTTLFERPFEEEKLNMMNENRGVNILVKDQSESNE